MSRIALSNTGDWKLQFEDTQDVRGFRVVDKHHHDTGLYVEDMIVDTDQEMVDAVVFSDGTEYPARDLSIGDGVVYATADVVEGGRLTRDIENYGRVEARAPGAYTDSVIVEYEPDYRRHHASAYGESGRDYDGDLEHAYRFGTETAYHGDYRNRAYGDAEADLRTGYEARQSGRSYDADREAIRYGFNRARGVAY